MKIKLKCFASVIIMLMGFATFADTIGNEEVEILEAEASGRTWRYYVVIDDANDTGLSSAAIWGSGGGTTASASSSTLPSSYAIIVGATPTDGDISIPYNLPVQKDNSTYNYTVAGIADCAFKDCSELTKVSMGEDVIAIGDCAFENCTSLTNVSTVASTIGRKVFSGCTSLEHLYLLNSLLSRVGSKVITSYDELRTYHYWSSAASPTKLCNINESFFADELTEPLDISLFDTVNPGMSIESYEEGRRILVELKETEIDGQLWRYYVRQELNSGGYVWTMDSSVAYVDGAVILGVTPAIGAVTIPDTIDGHSVVGVGDNAFNNCKEMTSIILPYSVVYMGDATFYGCDNLTRIKMPEQYDWKIPQICPYYDAVYSEGWVSYNHNWYDDIDKIGLGINQAVPLVEPTKNNFTVVLTSGGEDVVSITIDGDRHIATMADGDSTLGVWAGEIEPSYNPTLYIEESGRKSNWGSCVTSLIIGEDVRIIGHGFFDDFPSLEEVIIPNTVEHIVPKCNTNQVDRNKVVRYVIARNHGWISNDGEIDFYGNWNLDNYSGDLCEDEERQIYDLISLLPKSAFEKCNNLKKLTIPQCVCSPMINDVFLTAKKTVTEVTIADGVTYIDDLTFEGWSNLQKVVIPASVTRIGANAFKDCGRLETIVFEGDSPDVGADAFIGTPRAMEFEITEGTIGWDGGLSSELPEIWNGRRIAATGTSGSGTGGGTGSGSEAPISSEVYLTVTNVVVHYILNSVVPEVAVPVSEDTGFVTVVTEIKGGAVSIPETWKADDAEFVEKFGSDFAAALTKPTGKKDAQGNPLMVWQDFVAGTDPTDENDVFTASITMVDGEVKISYTPELSEEEAAKRKYVTYGKASLQDEDWQVVDGNADDFNFFKVTVEMR